MLVGVRLFSAAEVTGGDRSLERYYSVYEGDHNMTIVDVTDNRARKVLNFDFSWNHNRALFRDSILPLLQMVTDGRKLQASIVIDGSQSSRKKIIGGKESTVVQSTEYILGLDTVETVYMAVVALESNNRLADCLGATAESDGDSEPVVMEDTKDHFTSVEDATYVDCREEEGHRLLHALDSLVLDTKHQVFSFIIVFRDSDRMPNTTVQFVSLSVEEVSRGMKSTRHCISSSASLIECRSPSLSFAGTKFSFLLKPAMLGFQPGLWVSCLSPVSATHPSERESFKEAFCVAQLASKVFSSRVGVRENAGMLLPRDEERVNPFNAPDADVIDRRMLDTPFRQKHSQASPRQHDASFQSPIRDIKEDLLTAQAPPGMIPSIERERSDSMAAKHQGEDTCSAHYELSNYKKMMDGALGQLRSDMRTYIAQLENTKHELVQQKSIEESAMEENLMLRQQVDALLKVRDELKAQLQSSAEPQESSPKPVYPDQSEMYAARTTELLDMIEYHQQEIQSHVRREESYRNRVLELTALLTEKEERIIQQETEIKLLKNSHKEQVNSYAAEYEERNAALEQEVLRMKEHVRELKRHRQQQEGEMEELKKMLRSTTMQKSHLEKEAVNNADIAQEMMRKLKSQYETKIGAMQRDDGSSHSPTPNRSSNNATAQHSRFVPEREVFQSGSFQSRNGNHNRKKSFDEFMNEEPRYKLHR
ncbi:hypothetical protein AGDE_12528 [Angomonas deanei]|uniref:Kinesin motor domain containing protein n=1 Tax=Angomonas deanei TaxID=59799 RepID=A0A7G2CEP7_9TRYP|nr:hypothetical protein AGDE_12528 [Angomonas deanei]CAD2217153.1 hypothetical protein, conserved [Angomonas deanei]|eukprot:EPY24070.1 hypothetical protein AGDE_12528 [Angomonas deanei]